MHLCKTSGFFLSIALLWPLITTIDAKVPVDIPFTLSKVSSSKPKTSEIHRSKSDIQCGNNYKTYPMGDGWASCTNYGAIQYRCREATCYVGQDPKKLATEELYFFDCARLGIEELLPKILAVRYKAANGYGAIGQNNYVYNCKILAPEIQDANGQEYVCRWVKPTDPGNVRVCE
ncbi:hypothetical protein VP01_62g10 [Puccinia sorghi]|uniref:Uncharacterized protein n=1 Tax=Puccinia sorghi TaxID=27349 RepID=A0A0L6UIE2_9BASI|nr:hypothetical protein VP01_62g10 [Puccinia sorghi]